MAANLWPWLAVAGLGALHGLNPANGWMFAAAWGLHARHGVQQAWRALLPIAIGHLASVALVAGAVAQGMALDPARAQGLAGALLVAAAAYRWLRGTQPQRATTTPISTRAGHAGIALWSFLMATAHGAGLMLMPALVPLCLAGNPAGGITASGSVVLAVAAVGVHMAAMLVVTGVIATGVCRGVATYPRLRSGTGLRRASIGALAVAGVLLMALR